MVLVLNQLLKALVDLLHYLVKYSRPCYCSLVRVYLDEDEAFSIGYNISLNMVQNVYPKSTDAILNSSINL